MKKESQNQLVELTDDDIIEVIEGDCAEKHDFAEKPSGQLETGGTVRDNIVGVREKIRDRIAKSIEGVGLITTKLKARWDKDSKMRPRELEKWGAIGMLMLGMNLDGACDAIDKFPSQRDFYENFNYSLYRPYSSEKLRESALRETVELKPEEVRFALESLARKELNLYFDGVFIVKKTNAGLLVSLNLKGPKEGLRFLNSNFLPSNGNVITHSVSGGGEEIYFNFVADGVNLIVRQDLEGIAIRDEVNKNNISFPRGLRWNGGIINDTSILNNKEFLLAEGGGVLVSQGHEYQVFITGEGESMKISDVDSFIDFLKTCSSRDVILSFLDNENGKGEGDSRLDMRRINSMNQLIEILRLIGDDDEMYIRFVKLSMNYLDDLVEIKAGGEEREYSFEGYRHPLLSVKMGGGDCDDFTVLNYLRAHVVGYKPYVVRTSRSWFDVDTKTMMSGAHVFVAYENKKRELVVMDNDSYTNMGVDGSIEKYIEDRIVSGHALPGAKIDWIRNF